MELAELLTHRADEVLAAAMESVSRSHLRSYEEAGPESTRERLRALFDRVVESVRTRRLDPMKDYGRQLAEERFRAGYDLLEVQTAVNVVEEAIWKAVVRDMAPDDYATAFAMTSTALGAAKDALARAYVGLASHSRTPCVNVESLFRGTDGHHHG